MITKDNQKQKDGFEDNHSYNKIKSSILFKIFPNADLNLFEHYLRLNKNNVENALYCYGLFKFEFEIYAKEINELKEALK